MFILCNDVTYNYLLTIKHFQSKEHNEIEVLKLLIKQSLGNHFVLTVLATTNCKLV